MQRCTFEVIRSDKKINHPAHHSISTNGNETVLETANDETEEFDIDSRSRLSFKLANYANE